MENQNIVLLDLFSGIGGFAEGLRQGGYNITKHYFSEIDKWAIGNYQYNFKHAEYVGSVTDVRGQQIDRPNIITFGSTCQDFSLAGKRTGMGGERSSLILEAIRLISECRPDVFIWENVKGAFSSNSGEDFWAIIQAFANIGGYRLEWQLLNTSWFLPQNRERIYLIGHASGASFPGVFPITKNDGLPAKQNRPNKRWPQTKHCTTINTGFGNKADDTYINVPTISNCLTAGVHSGGLHSDMLTIQVVAQRGRKAEGESTYTQEFEARPDKNSNTLTSVTTDNQVMQLNPSVESGGKQPYQQNRIYSGDGISPALDQAAGRWGVKFTKNYLQWDTNGKGQNSQPDRAFYEDGICGTIPSSRTDTKVNILTKTNLRRLTEIECERLQGFADDWTKYAIINGVQKPIPRSQRYKLCGNAVTVAVVKAVASRLIKCKI